TSGEPLTVVGPPRGRSVESRRREQRTVRRTAARTPSCCAGSRGSSDEWSSSKREAEARTRRRTPAPLPGGPTDGVTMYAEVRDERCEQQPWSRRHQRVAPGKPRRAAAER